MSNVLEFPRPVIAEDTYLLKFVPGKATNSTFQPATCAFKKVEMPEDFINEAHVIDEYAKPEEEESPVV